MPAIKNHIQKRLQTLSIVGLSGIRKQFLKDKHFSIIANNCWGGKVYQHYGLEYQSPTVGLYFFASDYIEFCKNLDHYLNSQLKFITGEESKHYQELANRKQEYKPIGILDNSVEIVFLHYADQKEAYEKWNRRVDRVQKNNIILKFSEMDLCRPEHIELFNKLPYKKKVCFTANEYSNCASSVQVLKICRDNRVADDTKYYADYIDLTSFINNGEIKRKKASRMQT